MDYVDQGNPDCGGFNTHKMLRKDAENGAKVCTGSRTESAIKVKRHLKVRSNERVFYAYLPNGHIAKDKKAIGTKYGAYWTGKPRAGIHSRNDIKTKTLIPGSSADFDDVKCGETYESHERPSGRGGDGFLCIGEVKIPPNRIAEVAHMQAQLMQQNDKRGLQGNIVEATHQEEIHDILSISFNFISQLPSSFMKLRGLEVLRANGNCFNQYPAVLHQQDRQSIRPIELCNTPIQPESALKNPYPYRQVQFWTAKALMESGLLAKAET
ncbi:hypothetical protein ABG067_003938 [Albugo candida]